MFARNGATGLRLGLLLLGWTLAFSHHQVVAQSRAKDLVTRARRNRVSFAQFRRMVLNGREVTRRFVPSSYLLRVLEEAPLLLKQSSFARLRLNSCHIAGPRIRLRQPVQMAGQYTTQIQEHLSERELPSAIYVDFPIEIRNTTCDADLYFTDVVFQKGI